LNVRTRVQPEAIVQPVQRLAPELPFLEVDTLANEVAETTAPERTTAVLASLFGVVAAFLAGIGTFGLLSYAVRQRRREIGIRMALGARAGNVATLVARETLVMTVSGVIVGAAAAIPAASAMRSLLYGMSPNDPFSFAAAGLFVTLVAAIATVAPVLSATRVQPAEALRLD
jgi:ABC-type antimicrobial peptide transport system permease subunit